MPVELLNQKKGLQPRRLRFVRNTAYKGTDYGPDYGQDECQVDPASAFRFIEQGRAIDLDAPQEVPVTVPGEVQTRDPQPANRDPEIVQESIPAAVPTRSRRPRADKPAKEK